VVHVPPQNPGTKIPVDWMRAPVADTPNNWVQVEKHAEKKIVAEVGKETYVRSGDQCQLEERENNFGYD
jgi:hypothetical protein